jgi:MFS family permease
VRTEPTRETRLARIAVSAVFFLTGVGTANWAVRIPAVQAHLGLSDGRLGIALLGVSAGALLSMPLAGRLVARHGSRPVAAAAALAFSAVLALPPHAPGLLALALSLLLLGITNGLLDVSMNAHAAALQQRYAQPIMGRVHAMYSFGGLVGAVVGGRIAARRVEASTHLALVGAVLAVAALVAARGMLPADADAAPERSPVARPTRALVALGVVAFCVLFGEGAMANWSAIYLRDVAGAGPGLAAAGFAAFSLMMASGRAVGDTLTVRLGAERLVRVGGALAALGIAVALGFRTPWAVAVGFGAVGAGLAASFPIVLATAARTPNVVPGAAIALVSMCGYSGLLAGPPIIGAVASWLTLPAGVGIVGVTSVVIVGLARVLRAHEPDATLERPDAVSVAVSHTRAA